MVHRAYDPPTACSGSATRISPVDKSSSSRQTTKSSRSLNQDITTIKSILPDIQNPGIKAALEDIINDQTCKSKEQKNATLTHTEMLSLGLSLVGFDRARQNKVCTEKNSEQFKAFFGKLPPTLLPLFLDLRSKFPDIQIKIFLMTMNWFTLYEPRPVLAGRWSFCEDYIGRKVKECGAMIASLMSTKIKFSFENTNRVFVSSFDCVNFLIQEPRLDPSSKWFDHKSHSAGLVSLQIDACLIGPNDLAT